MNPLQRERVEAVLTAVSLYAVLLGVGGLILWVFWS